MPLSDFPQGQRVAAHPATDAWMQGDRYGTVLSAKHEPLRPSGVEVRVLLDKSKRKIYFDMDNLVALRD